jgi:hypothetical protein
MTINIDAQFFLSAIRVKHQFLRKRIIIMGRVIDVKGKQQTSNMQVILWMVQLTDGVTNNGKEARVVLLIGSNGNGYVSEGYPKRSVGHSYGIIYGRKNEMFLIPLEKIPFQGT